MIIRILSINIHKGYSTFKARFILPKLRSTLKKTDADIVFLQEVMGLYLHDKKTQLEPQFEFLAESIWKHHAYGKNAIYSKGDHGNALLSTFPFVYKSNKNISTNRYEKRGILHGIVEVPTKRKKIKIHLLCVHLDLLERGRVKQMREICQYINRVVPPSSPLILAGDFNDWRKKISSFLEKELFLKEAYVEKTGKHLKTFPSFFPLLTLDRIYYRKFKLLKIKANHEKQWGKLSDHIPVYAEFELEKES